MVINMMLVTHDTKSIDGWEATISYSLGNTGGKVSNYGDDEETAVQNVLKDLPIVIRDAFARNTTT